jgi:hypothetical protein
MIELRNEIPFRADLMKLPHHNKAKELQTQAFSTGKTKMILTLQKQPALGLTMSSDEHWLRWSDRRGRQRFDVGRELPLGFQAIR